MTLTDPPRTSPSAAPAVAKVPAADAAWRVVLYVYTLGVVAMFFLAGEGIWRAGSGNTGSSTLEPHRTLGSAMDLLALLLLVTALVARRSRPIMVLSAAVLVLNVLQGIWVNLADETRVLGGLHTVGALAIVATLIPMHRLAGRRR